MKKWLIWGLLAALILGGLYYLQTSVEEQIADEVRSAVGNDAKTNVDLSLKGIELKQGEDGKELWTLTASNGWYQKDESIIDLAEPHITYFLQPDREKVVVVAPHGMINQNDRFARLWGNVTVTNKKGVVTSKELTFNDEDKSLTMTGDVTFTGDGFNGSSDQAKWDLIHNELITTGNVVVEFQTDALKDVNGGDE